MPEPDRATDEARDDLVDRVRALEHEVRRLRDALDTDHAARADEVRTQRLVVVERDGFERIVAEAGGTHGSLAVCARAAAAGSTKVELFADDPVDGDGTDAGIVLGRDGDVVASLEVDGRGEPVLWIDGVDDR